MPYKIDFLYFISRKWKLYNRQGICSRNCCSVHIGRFTRANWMCLSSSAHYSFSKQPTSRRVCIVALLPSWLTYFFRNGTLIWQLEVQFSVYSWRLTFHVITSLLSYCSAVLTGGRKTWLRQKFNNYSPFATTCTISVNITNSTLWPHIVLTYSYRSHNKQQLFYYTELSDWFL
jgi:hypothetical protein